MRITEAKLIKLGACDGEWGKYFVGKKSVAVKLLLDAAIADERYSYAQWVLSRLMTNKQQINWAGYYAEQVIKIYEDKYPDNPAYAAYAAYAAATYSAKAAFAAEYKTMQEKLLRKGLAILLEQSK